MPASTRGKARDTVRLVAVTEIMYYGWNASDIAAGAGVSDSDLATALGHKTLATASDGVMKVFGANAPKPARVTKKLANAPITSRASVGTFCAYNTLNLAQAAGWRITSPAVGVRLRAASPGARTIHVGASLSNGLIYIQSVDPTVATAERRQLLDLDDATGLKSSDVRRFVRGSRSKPGKVRFALEAGSKAVLPYSSASASTANNIQAADGYEIISREFVDYPTAIVPF